MVGKAHNLIDEVGNRHGQLVVLQRVGVNSCGDATWLCQCDCGNTTITSGHRLRKGDTRSCGCIKRLPLGEGAFNNLFWKTRQTALRRGRNWHLTKDEFRQLTSQSCYYCGSPPSKEYYPSGDYNGSYQWNGIDRLDNDKDYTIDNVVTCCWRCNRMKLNQSVNDFLQHISRIYAHAINLG